MTVDRPNCLDLRTMLKRFSWNCFTQSSWNGYVSNGIMPRSWCWILQYFFMKYTGSLPHLTISATRAARDVSFKSTPRT